jgi:hypothetical protein
MSDRDSRDRGDGPVRQVKPRCSGNLESTLTLAQRSGKASGTPATPPAPAPEPERGSGRPTESPSLPAERAESRWVPGNVVGGRYRLIRLLGVGGVGQVLAAEDLFLRRKVALKTLNRDLANDQAALETFRLEVAMAHTVTHEGLARTFDMGQEQGVIFISMEFLEGESMASRLKRDGPFPISEARKIGKAVATAVAAAHRAGIVHRDLKPSNVQLGTGRGPVVMDFGVAAAIDRPDAPQPSRSRSELVKPTTAREGSPIYMAPEQWRGEKQGAATDIYAFGAILFQALTGRPPFEAQTLRDMMEAHLKQTAPLLRTLRPDTPAFLERLVAQCLEKDPARRPRSMDDVAAGLADPPVGRHLATAGLALGALVLAIVAAFVLWSASSRLLVREMRPAVERLAVLSSQAMDVADLEQVRTPDDIANEPFQRTLAVLERVKEENPEVLFIYTLRKLAEGDMWEFVVDVDYEDEDLNGDGIIQPDEEGSPPGLVYDAGPFPRIRQAWGGVSVGQPVGGEVPPAGPPDPKPLLNP